MTLAKVIKDFKFHCEFEKNLSSKTLQAYTIDLNHFEVYKDYKNINIQELDKHILKDYVQRLYGLNLKVKTIKRKLAF